MPLIENPSEERSFDIDSVLLSCWSLCVFAFLLFTATISSYGYFIDELYYIACSKRLAFGYIDHPPLSVGLLAASRALLGESRVALRFFPSAAIAANVLLAGLLTRRLGGSRGAVIISTLAATGMPVYLLMGSFYSMNAFEPVIWTGVMYLVARMVQEERPQYWIWIGVLMGVGLELKHTIAVYAVALGAGFLFTPYRRYLMSKSFAWGVLIAFLLILPNLLWQYAHGFPSAEFYRNAMVNKNVPRSPLQVFLDQLLFANPLSAFVWIAGLLYLLLSRQLSEYRLFGWAYVVMLAFLMASGASRPDRIASMYTVLFAAGGVAISNIPPGFLSKAVFVLSCLLLIAGMAIFAPVSAPILPPAETKDYLAKIGFSANIEQGKMNEALPQWFSDRLGWPELALEVETVARTLTPEEKRNAVIVCDNYGDAGAIELYRTDPGLPPVYSVHNSYHLWGPPPDSARTYILVHIEVREVAERFDSVVEAAIYHCADCSGPQRRVPILIARGPKFKISQEWARLRDYN